MFRTPVGADDVRALGVHDDTTSAPPAHRPAPDRPRGRGTRRPQDHDAVTLAHTRGVLDCRHFAQHKDRPACPGMRTWKMFREWFDVEVIGVACELDGVKPEGA